MKAKIDLRLGDCFEILKSVPDHSIDCIVTDPPYGNTHCDFDCIVDEPTLLRELKRVVKPKRAVCIFCMLRMAVRLINIDPKWFRYEWILAKQRATGFLDCKKRPLRAHELLLIFGDGQPLYNPLKTAGKEYKMSMRHGKQALYTKLKLHYSNNNNGDRYPTTILPHNNVNYVNNIHPTQKPVDLCEYLIRTYSNAGDVILDPFAGSGTTAVACIQTGRNFIGCEINEKYYKLAVDRIEKAQKAEEEKLPLEINE